MVREIIMSTRECQREQNRLQKMVCRGTYPHRCLPEAAEPVVASHAACYPTVPCQENASTTLVQRGHHFKYENLFTTAIWEIACLLRNVEAQGSTWGYSEGNCKPSLQQGAVVANVSAHKKIVVESRYYGGSIVALPPVRWAWFAFLVCILTSCRPWLCSLLLLMAFFQRRDDQ